MLLFCQSKPIAFLPFSLTSPSSLLKLLNGAVRLCKPTGAMDVAFSPFRALLRSFANLHIERIHMTSRRPYWFSKTMKRRPCWFSKQILWGLDSFLMQNISFVPINLHRCWPREWIRSIHNTRTFFPWILMRILFATVSIIPMCTPNRAKNASIMPNTWHTGMIARYTATEVTQYNKMTLQSYLKRV